MSRLKNVQGLFFLLIFVFQLSSGFAQTLTVDEIKAKVNKRIEDRKQIIKDFTCELSSERNSDSPRGEIQTFLQTTG